VTCRVVQERDPRRLYEAVSHSARTGASFAVLDPTWPPTFLDMAAGQIEDAASGGQVGRGDMVVFSSGSTGRPRGIVRTVESWTASLAPFSQVSGITAADTVWLPGPLCSSLFLYGAFHAGAVGARMVFRDDDPTSATALHCVPSQLPALLLRAEGGGLPLVSRVVVAGDHCATTLRDQCRRRGWQVVEYYGAAELSFVTWRHGCGPMRPFAGVQTQLRAGVLWARSPYLARGYLTTDGGGPLRRDRQGWATVQDLARAVADGLEISGRGNSAVTSGGHTVVVEEVERLLQALPGVDEVAVLGVAHPRLGQVLTAVVVGPALEASLRAAVAGMPAPSRPRRWLHADALPHTSGGKLRRSALKDLVLTLSKP
jgi:long-chain acyl-CoA synthetase